MIDMAGINREVWFAGLVFDFHRGMVNSFYMTRDANEAAMYKRDWRDDYGTAQEAREIGYRILHYAHCSEAEALYICGYGRINYFTPGDCDA